MHISQAPSSPPGEKPHTVFSSPPPRERPIGAGAKVEERMPIHWTLDKDQLEKSQNDKLYLQSDPSPPPLPSPPMSRSPGSPPISRPQRPYIKAPTPPRKSSVFRNLLDSSPPPRSYSASPTNTYDIRDLRADSRPRFPDRPAPGQNFPSPPSRPSDPDDKVVPTDDQVEHEKMNVEMDSIISRLGDVCSPSSSIFSHSFQTPGHMVLLTSGARRTFHSSTWPGDH